MEEYNNTLYNSLIEKCQEYAIYYYQEKKKKKIIHQLYKAFSKINFRELILLNLVNFFIK